MKIISLVFFLIATKCLAAPASITLTDLKAFPTAHGAGAGASGGRGGQVIYVTTTAEEGPGSLREALRTEGARTILFAIGGRFNLSRILYIGEDTGSTPEALGNFTIAGQTANDLGGVHFTSEGIEADNRFYIEQQQNFILRYLDTKHQWAWFQEFGDDGRRSSLSLPGCYNVILDHCSSGWGSYTFGFAKHNLIKELVGEYTLQNCLNHEGVVGHSVANVTGQNYLHAREAAPEDQLRVWNMVSNLDFYQNAYIGVTHRTPNVDGGENGKFRVVNNFIYGWSSRLTHITGSLSLDLRNNIYQKSLNKPSINRERMHVMNFNANLIDRPQILNPSIYAVGNQVISIEGQVHALTTNDNWNMFSHFQNSPEGTQGTQLATSYRRDTPLPHSPYPIPMREVVDLENHILADVGAAVRFREDGTTYYADPIDDHYLSWARERSGPNRSSTALGDGGLGDTTRFIYPDYPSESRDLATFDTDRDGMPNTWEITHDLDPNDPSDGTAVKLTWTIGNYAVTNQAGYQNLEIYLADIAGDFHRLARERMTYIAPPTFSGNHAASIQNESPTTDGWTWNSNLTVSAVNGAFVFTDPDAELHPARFGKSSLLATTSASGVYDRVDYRFDTEPGAKYEISLWARRGKGETQMLTQWQGTESFQVQPIDTTTWKNYRQTVTATGTEITLRAYVSVQGEVGDSLYLDGLSIIKVSPGSLNDLADRAELKIQRTLDETSDRIEFQMPAANELTRPHYTLQRSKDLSSWLDLPLDLTQDGTSATATIPASSPCFYRLKLTANE